MDRLLVTGGARLAGSVRISGRQELAPSSSWRRALLAPGRCTISQRPQDPGLPHDGRGPGAPRRRASRWDGDRVDDRRAPTSTSVEAPYELVRRMRASIVVLGPLLARRGRGARGDARRRQHRLAPDRPPPRRASSGWAPRSRMEHGFLARARADGCAAPSITLDYPSVGATENLLMAAVAATGHDRDRQRRARARDRGPRGVPGRRWVRGSTAPGPARSRSRACERLRAGRARGDPRPDRGGHVRDGGRARRAGTSCSTARAPTTWSWRCRSSRTPAPRSISTDDGVRVRQRRPRARPSTSSRCRIRASRPTSSRC